MHIHVLVYNITSSEILHATIENIFQVLDNNETQIQEAAEMQLLFVGETVLLPPANAEIRIMLLLVLPHSRTTRNFLQLKSSLNLKIHILLL